MALPSPPQLVFRVAFAGNRDYLTEKEKKELTADQQEALQYTRTATVAQKLDEVLALIANRLRHPQVLDAHGQPRTPSVTAYYADAPPVLRLITGLAEGADHHAALALERLTTTEARRTDGKPVQTQLAAVLGCSVKDYRHSRAATYQPEFDRLVQQCHYVLALDGIYLKDPKDEKVGKPQRARLYRAQATFLLRHADLLVAVVNPGNPGNAGGTMETMREALAFGLPVVLIDVAATRVEVVEPGRDELAAALENEPVAPSKKDWQERLVDVVLRQIAGPDLIEAPKDYVTDEKSEERDRAEAYKQLALFFDEADAYPVAAKGDRVVRNAEKWWTAFENLYRPAFKSPGGGTKTPYRERASDLNGYYAGRYRGTFASNYVLAAAAIACAVGSLRLLGPEGAGWSYLWVVDGLLLLGVLKLWIVVTIFQTSEEAHHGFWVSRAVNFRYLSERLRTAQLLGQLGSFQPPPPETAQYATRATHQSIIDWLFRAIVRTDGPVPVATTFTWLPQPVNLVTIDTTKALKEIGVGDNGKGNGSGFGLLGEQVAYHAKTHRKHKGVNGNLKHWAESLNKAMPWIVGADIILTFLVLAHVILKMAAASSPVKSELLAHLAYRAHELTYWLIPLTALMPAIVASINGIRFQSEVGRLAEKSKFVYRQLNARSKQVESLQEKMTFFVDSDNQ